MHPTSRPVRVLALVAALVVGGCPNDVAVEDPDTTAPDASNVDVAPDTVAPPDTSSGDTGAALDSAADTAAPDTAEADTAEADTSEPPQLCVVDGGFGCACQDNGDCLDEICIEGRDGLLCTKTCIAECPSGFDCLSTTHRGDPISICVPRHVSLCRPCLEAADCDVATDPDPAYCVPAADPDEGRFCTTSCAHSPCPEGYACADVEVQPGVTASQCVPDSGLCECRASWGALGFSTRCAVSNDAGVCDGTRFCGAEGLTACNAATPSAEICNGVDDDCDGETDNIAAAACEIVNDFGTCPGLTACNGDGAPVCEGPEPSQEVCDGADNDCDGTTDVGFVGCASGGCSFINGSYIAVGAPACVGGDCVNGAPIPCGLFTCEGGGDAGDACATHCDDDTHCIAEAHCNAGTGNCVLDGPNGSVCWEDANCASGHCQNGYCCDEGDCCSQPLDCPPEYASEPVCVVPETCSGSRIDAACTANQCVSSSPQDDDRGCGPDTLAKDCSPLLPQYCNGGFAQAEPLCAALCDDDGDCLEGFHCDTTCQPDLADGLACDEATDCASGHCDGGYCCAGDGACCATAADCPPEFSTPAECLSVASCQGERTDAICDSFRCGSAVRQDDSACGPELEASPCGPYASIYCTGAEEQDFQQCPFSCTDDAQCDAGFHCDGACVPDLADGAYCDEDSDCVSAHCGANVCCSGGDCCNSPADCPPEYSGQATCDFASTCQGSQATAICVGHVCGTDPDTDDDSACLSTVLAKDCGPYPAVYCAGGAFQSEPQCATACSSSGECDTDAFCDGDTCREDLADGQACSDASQCRSGHCANGYCCDGGDCCVSALDCDDAIYREAATCVDNADCQGVRRDPACVDSVCQLGPLVGDDSDCAGHEASACGLYPSVFCGVGEEQQAPTCPETCAGDGDCDPGANCTGGVCVPDQSAGGDCSDGTACSAGLTCVDGVCCTTPCGGDCQRCDLPGAEGQCLPVPDGQDPDDECGAVSCVGHYWGFDVGACHRRADVQNTACNGAGGCQAASVVCPGASMGPETSTCHEVCQVPDAATCAGTTPGQCTDVTGGTVSCGVGDCVNTVDRCVDGHLATCAPLPGGDEVCDGVDNDCDGLTDAADAADLLAHDAQLCEKQAGVCALSTKPASRCVGGVWGPCTNSIYAGNSVHYQPSESVCDERDNDCDGVVDEMTLFDEDNCGACLNPCANPHGTTVCSGGTCVPICDLGWASCDGDPDDGCEASINTNARCGSCGGQCYPDNGTGACGTGTCVLSDCDNKFCDLNLSVDDGCELDLDTDPVCSDTAVNLGTIRGDTGSDLGFHSNRGERWLRFFWKEDNDGVVGDDLTARITLTSPLGADGALMDYDLEVYCGCETFATASATNGAVEEVVIRKPDDTAAEDDVWIYILVKTFAVDECPFWSLRIEGDVGAVPGSVLVSGCSDD